MASFSEWFGGNVFKSILTFTALTITVMGLFLAAYRRRVTKENSRTIGNAFKETIAGLSSPSIEVRMSSAILLRRFLDKKSEYGVGGAPFAKATVNVIAAVLKTMQTSDLQKVLADTLRFAPKGLLKKGDFQRANLSKAFLAGKHMDMERADFFQANLTGTHLKQAMLDEAQFYEATLIGTKFNEAMLREANFAGSVLQNVDFAKADLTGATFDNTRLSGVNFVGAILDEVTGVNATGYDNPGAPSFITRPEGLRRMSTDRVFISRLGALDARQRLLLNSVRDIVEQSDLSLHELKRDMYDATNVLSNLSDKISSCSAMIVFGFKSTHVIDGVFRYNTEDACTITNVFMATPWNHIEVGMAVMKGIPVLLLVDDDINDGVFQDTINDEMLMKMPIKDCLDEKKMNVASWLESVTRQPQDK
jgi:uncharacterized protein YjbI with pentapeptide repeats